jgi:probable addiction module antidote protein
MTEVTPFEKSLGLTAFDVRAHLTTPEDCQLYLQAAIEQDDGDGAFILDALRLIADAQGMTDTAAKAGLNRSALYKILDSKRAKRPSFAAIFRVIRALGFTLVPAPRPAPETSQHAA